MPATDVGTDWGELVTALPAELRVPDIRSQIRAANREAGRRLAVLDDDPTGSQCVHGVPVVTVPDPAEYLIGLREAGSTCFVLTNSRSLTEADAVALTTTAADDLLALDLGGPVEIVSRSDSCLRGHVIAETAALRTAYARAGRPVDAVLFAPALPSAGRYTVGDTQWARVDGQVQQVARTEYAADATFGYENSHLPDFLTELSRGSVRARDVLTVGLGDIRRGGPGRVAQILGAARGAQWVVVNALTEHDLDVVALGVTQAQAAGATFAYRTGPAFVRALAGIEPQPALEPANIVVPQGRTPGGLIVVGSHTRTTTTQLERLAGLDHPPARIEIEVETLLGGDADAHVADVARRVVAELSTRDVVLYTSRTLTRGADKAGSLEIARRVSGALVDAVAAVRGAGLPWVLAKGGITSHDVAVRGLGIRRADVAGQLGGGGVSLFSPVDAPEEIRGVPYAVFPGNVGGADSLRDVVQTLHAARTDT